MRPVGILGGMAPQTTSFVLQKLLAAQHPPYGNHHVPLIVNHKPQLTPQVRLMDDDGGQDPMPALMSMAQDLERAGAQALAMPSVEAHHYAIAVSHATTLPFLNMIEITADHLKAKSLGKIGILADTVCRSHEVFDAVFEHRGLSLVWNKNDKAVAELIKTANSGDQQADIPVKLLSQVQALVDQGADHVLLAQTELSPYLAQIPNDVPLTDSLDCLCDAIVTFASR